MIYIIKRNNEKQEYDKHKIAHAISKCFDACGTPIEQDKLDKIVEYVDNLVVNSDEIWSVEQIQDSVEHALMKEGYLTEAKKYILYREKQTELRKIKYEIAEKVGIPKLFDVLSKIKNDFTDEVYSLSILNNKFNNFVKANDTRDEAMDAIILRKLKSHMVSIHFMRKSHTLLMKDFTETIFFHITAVKNLKRLIHLSMSQEMNYLHIQHLSFF